MFFNVLYLDLVGWVLLLCLFIPFWVLFLLFWQFFCFSDVKGLPREDNVVELVWTVLPTLVVGVLCFLNLRCVTYDAYRCVTSVVKVVGHQWF